MKKNVLQYFKIGAPILGAILFYLYPCENLSDSGQRVGGIFLLAAGYWIFETMPVYATSLLIIFLELLFLSDKTIPFFRPDANTVIPYESILYTFSNPIIFLFLGGFFLAIASKKIQLDKNIVRVIIAILGTNPKKILFALMFMTSLFSMFMSNTATTAMMLAMLTPILVSLPSEDSLRKVFVLSIPIAANIGGIGTPIGTPPNAIALATMQNNFIDISFGKWMLFGVPYVMVMIMLSWFLLLKLFPSNTKNVRLTLTGTFSTTPTAIFVYITFGGTIMLWLTSSVHGIPSSIVAFVPILLFSISGVIDKRGLREVQWDILWLISGGLALGLAMEKTGLDRWIIEAIPLDSMAPFIIISSICLLGIVMSTFISNTATANLLIPLAMGFNAILANDLGEVGLSLMLAFSCSIAMALPISTPPNALAYATGFISGKDLMKVGSILSFAGFILLLLYSQIWKMIGLL